MKYKRLGRPSLLHKRQLPMDMMLELACSQTARFELSIRSTCACLLNAGKFEQRFIHANRSLHQTSCFEHASNHVGFIDLKSSLLTHTCSIVKSPPCTTTAYSLQCPRCARFVAAASDADVAPPAHLLCSWPSLSRKSPDPCCG